MKDEDIIQHNEQHDHDDRPKHRINYISGMYKEWFLDYASYVILERAVPHLADGLKPVQRRILHSMKRMDDGRYNKVANIIGHTMQFHPHGDASIGDALVQLGQKELLIDMQGNWGNIYTGDNSAAPRYIEARLSKFAIDVVFNPKTTKWIPSYDGRNDEPLSLPMKFPLLLAQGAEGIAVGLACKIMPHNFIELIDASIKYLKGEDFVLYPDFPTGGSADVSNYNDGLRGGRVKVRARIEKPDKKTLIIKDLPFGKTTGALIESIIAANDAGKIKIKKIEDNTAAEVEILIQLPSDVSQDKTIDALYAVSDCEISISPNNAVIVGDKPMFLGVTEMLKISTDQTLNLLKLELEIRRKELDDDWHLSSLEKIFIENRIYLRIEDCETWECIISTIDEGLEPFKAILQQPVTTEDIEKLTEIKIKRISKFDAFKADRYIKGLEEEMIQVDYHLAHIVDYTIAYFNKIRDKYGVGKERKTEIRNFEEIHVAKVVIANQKLYANIEDGLAGTSLKQATYVCDCSDIDDIITFRDDGTYFISKVSDKFYIGKGVIHIAVWKKSDERTVYNAVYRDGKIGAYYMKRFTVVGITRDKEYDLTKGTEGSKVMWFTANPNGEAEIIRIFHRPRKRLKKRIMDVDFAELAIKGRQAMGNLVTKYPVLKFQLQTDGVSTLGGREIYFDADVNRLNADGRGELLGEFQGSDKILVIYKSGEYQTTGFDLSTHFDRDILRIEQHDPEKVFSAVLWDAEQGFYYLKRFTAEETELKTGFIGDHAQSKLTLITDEAYPQIKLIFGGENKNIEAKVIDVEEFIGVKSAKARGKRLANYVIAKIEEMEPLEKEPVSDGAEATIEDPDFEVVKTDDEGNQIILDL